MQENIENKATRGSISQIILNALTSGDKYGYEICKDIERLSNGKLILKQPSLYSCLRRMEEQKLISSYWKDSLLGGRRHYYSVTEKGKQLYENNKNIWKNNDELLNNLPDNVTLNLNGNDKKINENNIKKEVIIKQKNKNKTEKIENEDGIDFVTLPSSTNQKNTLLVLDQENLFNLARKKDEDIKRINVENNENCDKNKSFLQFDFFEQNIKVVKKNNDKVKEDIQVFSNKYSNLDNHEQDIEPENIKSSQIKKEINQSLNINEIQENTNKISLSSIIDKEIKRDYENFKENLNDKQQQQEKYISIFDYMKNAEKDNKIDTSLDKLEIKLNSGICNNNSFYNEGTQNMGNKNETKNNLYEYNESKNELNNYQDISWEKTEIGDAPLFTHDYKSAIGKLYNNSQLKDPYEQNKFQNFKELFPSSTLQEKEKTEIKQTKIDAVIQSSSNSNIDCDDIKMLNNLYNLQGLNIKVHNNIENKGQNKIYKDKNKLNMVCSWIIAFIGFVEFLVSYLILNSQELFLSYQISVYLCCLASLLFISLFFTLKNFFDRYKLIILKKNFTKDVIVSILAFILFSIATFAINIALGMSSLSDIKYLSFWLVPCLLFSNLILTQGIYAVLLKIKYFNS